MINRIKNLSKKGFFHVFTGNILIKFISFFSSFLIVRLVSKEEFASFSYAENIYNYVNLICGLGLGSALVKVIAENENKRIKKSFLFYSLKIGSLFQIFVMICLALVILLVDFPFENTRFLMIGMLFIPYFDFILQLIQGYNRGALKNKEFARIGVLQSLILTFSMIVFVFFLGVKGSIIAKNMTFVIVIVYSILILKNDIKKVDTEDITRDQKKYIINLGISLMLANLFSSMMPINETFLVNNLIKDLNDSANFRVASLLPSQLIIITNSFIIYFFPIIAKERDPIKAQKIIKKLFYSNGIIILTITFLGILFTPFIIKFLYGEIYIDAIPVSYMLWIMRAINAIFRVIPMNILPALGRAKFNAWFAFVSTVIHFILDYYLIKTMGINGVAYASIIVYVVSGFGYWFYLLKIFNNKGIEETND